MAKFRNGDLVLTGSQKITFSTGASVNEFDTDVNLAADSDEKVATQKAVKAYVDAGGGGSGTSGSSGTSGIAGTSGSSGTSGIAGTSGSSGTSGAGTSGSSGTSGIAGTSGTSGIAGTSGSSGTSGVGGSGTSGSSGTSGTSSITAAGADHAVARYDDATTIQDSGVLLDDNDNITGVNDLSVDGSLSVGGQQVATREDVPIDMRVPWWNEPQTRFDTEGDTYIQIDQTSDTIVVDADSVLSMTITEDGLALETGVRVNEISNDSTTIIATSLLTAAAIHELNGAGWDSSPDNQTGSGDVTTMTVDSAASAFASALYISSSGNLEEADASDSTSVPCIALALEAGAGEKEVILHGFIRNDAWNWTNIGQSVYLSTTTGELTQTAPSVSGEQVQNVGVAKSADILYFTPNLTVEEVV